jgi:hypothetical protein
MQLIWQKEKIQEKKKRNQRKLKQNKYGFKRRLKNLLLLLNETSLNKMKM